MLADRIRNGDESALRDIFAEYYAELCDFALRNVHSRDIAESVVLEVIESVWQKRQDFNPRSTVRAYLFGAVRLRAMNVARSQSVQSRWEEAAAREDVLPGLGVPKSDAALTVETAELDAAIVRTIASLPGRCREVFELSWYNSLTGPEIASALGISLSAVKAHISRAYRELKVTLAPFVEKN